MADTSAKSSQDVESSGKTRPAFLDKLFAPIDIASLVFFRILFGAIMVWEVQRYFAKGEIAAHFITPTFHFHYWGFEWIHPLPGNGMYIVWGAMGVCGALIMIGLLYRAATITFSVLFAYMFLIEQTRYLNHFYLVLLVSVIMIFVPAHRAFSVDAKFRPSLRSNTAPAWSVWWIRFQIAVVYFFGGVHKTNPDWLHGEPMRTWLRNRPDFPLLGQWFDQEWMVSLFVYGGIAFDLLVVPALLWKWTRWPAFIGALGFHLFNSQFFTIGIFPWFMIAATLMFFRPDWPRRLLRRLPMPSPKAEVSGADPTPVRFAGMKTPRKALVIFMASWVIVQLAMPWRPYLYPGNILWSEQGMWFSWNMMLSFKEADVVFELHDPASGAIWQRKPEQYLTPFQQKVAVRRPEMILQLARHIAEEFRQQGFPDVEIYAKSLARINGRTPQVYLNPDVNLANVSPGFNTREWLVELKEKYPPKDAWKYTEIGEDQIEY